MDKKRLNFVGYPMINDFVDILISKNYCENGVEVYRIPADITMDDWFNKIIKEELKKFYEEHNVNFFSLTHGCNCDGNAFSRAFRQYAYLDDRLSVIEKELKEDYLGYSYIHLNYKVKCFKMMATKEHMQKVYRECIDGDPVNGSFASERQQACEFLNYFLDQGLSYKGFCLLFSDVKYCIDKKYPEEAQCMEEAARLVGGIN